MTTLAQFPARALEKLKRDNPPFGVAAAFVGEVSEPGVDGARWRVYACDGHRGVYIDLMLTGTKGGERGMPVDPVQVEAEVERQAGTFPREARLECLEASSPLSVAADRAQCFVWHRG
jgi:hypothetical protein